MRRSARVDAKLQVHFGRAGRLLSPLNRLARACLIGFILFKQRMSRIHQTARRSRGVRSCADAPVMRASLFPIRYYALQAIFGYRDSAFTRGNAT